MVVLIQKVLRPFDAFQIHLVEEWRSSSIARIRLRVHAAAITISARKLGRVDRGYLLW